MLKRLLIIDAHAVIHRAYHALPKLKTKKGELINAVYGFLLVFLKAVSELSPDYVVACFDRPEPTFRHKKFKDYKAQRPKTPKDLGDQIPKVKQILQAFSVSLFEKQGFEADDLIGTLANQAINESQSHTLYDKARDLETIVATGDLDMLQLVNRNVKVYALRKGVKDTVLYDENKVFEKYGFSPQLLPDFKALVGDASDNIPGVPGIGPKTASRLLKKFGSLEKIYKGITAGSWRLVIKERIKKKLLESKKQAFLSRELTQIQLDVDIDFDLGKTSWKNYNKDRAIKVLEEFEFSSLIKRLPGARNKNPGRLF